MSESISWSIDDCIHWSACLRICDRESAKMLDVSLAVAWLGCANCPNRERERTCHFHRMSSCELLTRRKCDICGQLHFGNDVPNYCEGCGAKVVMDE